MDAERREARRSEIIDAAVTLFSQRGYRQATMSELADHFGVTKPALYYYVGSKEGLLLHALERSFDRLEKRLTSILEQASDPLDQLSAWIESQVETAADPGARMLSAIDLTEGGLDEKLLETARRRNRIYMERVVGIVADGQRSGVIRSELDPTVVVFGIIGMCSWVARWYVPDGGLSPSQIARTYVTVVTESIRP